MSYKKNAVVRSIVARKAVRNRGKGRAKKPSEKASKIAKKAVAHRGSTFYDM